MKNRNFILALLGVLIYALFFWFIAPPRSVWRYLAIGIGYVIFGVVILINKNRNKRNDKPY